MNKNKKLRGINYNYKFYLNLYKSAETNKTIYHKKK